MKEKRLRRNVRHIIYLNKKIDGEIRKVYEKV